MRQSALWLAVVFLGGASCHPSGATTAAPPETREQCVARLTAFEAVVAQLPDRTVAAVSGGDLPISTLGALPGPGPVLEIRDGASAIDGTPLPGMTHRERAQQLAAWGASNLASAAPKSVMYVATSPGTDVQTVRTYLAVVPTEVEVRLLVRMPKAPSARGRTDTSLDEPATRLLLEQDPETRRAIAEKGYSELAHCPAVSAAIASVRDLGPRERWPSLKSALRAALPQCDCSSLDTVRLQPLVAAEQQGGAGVVGFVPLSFVRDERCGASMPLRSLAKLIKQVEQFDAEFAGNWQSDSLAFGDVVTNDRLRVYFCSALPGETLAQKERERATLYLRVPGSAACEPWRFEPLAPGSPMGTWRRAPSPARPALAYHYWQAAEELRVYGPIDPASPSKPTDQRDWACEQTHRLSGIDDHYIQLDDGRWFFDDATCRKAEPDSAGTAPPCAPKAAEPSPPAASATLPSP